MSQHNITSNLWVCVVTYDADNVWTSVMTYRTNIVLQVLLLKYLQKNGDEGSEDGIQVRLREYCTGEHASHCANVQGTLDIGNPSQLQQIEKSHYLMAAKAGYINLALLPGHSGRQPLKRLFPILTTHTMFAS